MLPLHTREYDSCAEEGSSGEFPMVAMPVGDFLTLGQLPPHLQALEAGLLRRCGGAPVHFVSHEWLGDVHPDPKAVHLRTLQRLFRHLLQPGGHLKCFSPEDWARFALGAANRLYGQHRVAARSRWGSEETVYTADVFEGLFRGDVEEGLVWFDFFSVPQVTGDLGPEARAAAMQDRASALRSLPSFVRQARYFYVCCPTARSERGRTCNFSSWQEQGWCRMAEVCNWLGREPPLTPLIVTEAPKVRLTSFEDYVLYRGMLRDCSVLAGHFACCASEHSMALSGEHISLGCDRDLLSPTLTALLDERLRALQAAGGDGFRYRLLRCLEPAILAESPADRLVAACPPEEPAEAFLRRFRLPPDPTAGDSQGATALLWAAFAGHAPMVDTLLAMRCDACAADVEGQTPLFAGVCSCDAERVTAALLGAGGLAGTAAVDAAVKATGMTPLARASRGRYAAVVQQLLSARACANTRLLDGSSPLLIAAEAHNAEICEVLLAGGADLAAVGPDGHSALHYAARGFSPFGRRAEHVHDLVSALLRARAEFQLRDNEGFTAVDVASRDNNQEFLRAMLLAEDEDSSQVRAWWSSVGASVVESV